MKINLENYFNHYIIHPLAPDLSLGERILALTCSIILFPVTIAIYYWKHRKITVINTADRQEKLAKLASSIEKINFEKLQPDRPKINIKLSQVPEIVNDKFIKENYAVHLPPREKVTVPLRNPETGLVEWKLWDSLTRKQKIQVNNTGTHVHNQINPQLPELAVDRLFFAHGQSPYIEGDPRQSHGNDHSCRASIFAGLFAYLYAKYHPGYEVSTQDIALCQIIAAGHDSGRQTEGPDVYDDHSAEITKKVLKKLEIQDPLILQECHEAIADKDSMPNNRKCLIAKCVQNADSAEFARLLLTSPRQEKTGFEMSRGYLDIYKELKKIAEEGNPENPKAFILKENYTFEDFCYELDALREEMNDFIYETHQRQFRQEAVQTDNYYLTILNAITPLQFPLLSAVLEKSGIKQSPPSKSEIKKIQTVNNIKQWQQYGFSKVPTESLQRFHEKLSLYDTPEVIPIRGEISTILQTRNLAEENYQRELSRTTIQEASLIKAYAELPFYIREAARKSFYLALSDLANSQNITRYHLVENTAKADPEGDGSLYHVVLLDLIHSEAKEALINAQAKEALSSADANLLQKHAKELLDSYKKADKALRDPGAQTTASLCLQKAAEIHLQTKATKEAKRALRIAAKEIILDESTPLFNLERLFQNHPKEAILFLPSDCGFLRKRKFRICQKDIINDKTHLKPEKYLELSIELTSESRQQVQKFLDLYARKAQTVPAKYLRKSGKRYLSSDSLEIGTDLQIEVVPGISVQLGNKRKYWNQYHLMRIRAEVGIPPQKIHEALSKIGLPMAMLPSRSDDMQKEILARCLSFRFPDLVDKKLAPETVYERLTAEQKLTINNDLKKSKMAIVAPNHYEIVQPEIAQEAWKAGVRSVACFINAGENINTAAAVMRNILNMGLMSTVERYQNGILGLGCAPSFNNQAGSANQVFARILTQNVFENNFPLINFPISGQIFIMMDPKVLERMPYSYLHDRGGIRNPEYYLSLHKAEKQEAIINFKGHERIKERKSFIDHITSLKSKSFPLNETMFDLNVGARYIRKLVVWSEVDRVHLITSLQKMGIQNIGYQLLEEAVVVAKELRPDLVDNFDLSENPEYHEAGYEDSNYI